MYKRVLSLLMVGVMSLMIPTNVYAYEREVNGKGKSEMVSVVNNSSNIDNETLEEIIESVEASLVYNDGNVVPLETEIVVEDIGSNMLSRSAGQTYSVRAATKVDIKAADKDDEGVIATVVLKMIWEDNPGVDNRLMSYNATFNVSKGSIKKVTIQYGNAYEMARAKKIEVYGNRYSYYSDVEKIYFAPFVSCDVQFVGANYSLYVMVKSSVFD